MSPRAIWAAFIAYAAVGAAQQPLVGNDVPQIRLAIASYIAEQAPKARGGSNGYRVVFSPRVFIEWYDTKIHQETTVLDPRTATEMTDLARTTRTTVLNDQNVIACRSGKASEPCEYGPKDIMQVMIGMPRTTGDTAIVVCNVATVVVNNRGAEQGAKPRLVPQSARYVAWLSKGSNGWSVRDVKWVPQGSSVAK